MTDHPTNDARHEADLRGEIERHILALADARLDRATYWAIRAEAAEANLRDALDALREVAEAKSMADLFGAVFRARYTLRRLSDAGVATERPRHGDATPPAPDAGAWPKVKPLGWESRLAKSPAADVPSRTVHTAGGLVGQYRIEEDDGQWHLSLNWVCVSTSPSFGLAKAAAQADYERRILSAFDLPGDAGAWRDMADAPRDGTPFYVLRFLTYARRSTPPCVAPELLMVSRKGATPTSGGYWINHCADYSIADAFLKGNCLWAPLSALPTPPASDNGGV